MILPFTTTSCCRSELLEQAYESFFTHFKGVDFKRSTLFLSLDYYKGIGDPDRSVKIAKKFFGDVVYRISENPNFSGSIKWLWNRSFNSDYVFHLEEDWILLSSVDINDMVSIFENLDGTIMSVLLRQRYKQGEGKFKRIKLCPSLFLSKFLRIHKRIKFSSNPEQCFMDACTKSRKWIARELKIEKTYSYVFTSLSHKKHVNTDPIVKDTGREWLEKRKNIIGIKGKKVRWEIK